MVALSVQPLDALPRALLCDMDGLLLDSERVILDCWRAVAAHHGHDVDDDVWLSMVGLHEEACAELLRGHIDHAAVDVLMAAVDAAYDGRIAAGLALRPGALALLDVAAAHRLPLALVSSTRRAVAVRKLASSALLPRFAASVFGDEVARRKPAPEPYLHAASLLGVAPSACLVLEDSVPGVRAGLAAGATVVQVPDLVHPDDDVRALGHRIVASLHEVVEMLQDVMPAGDRATD